MKKLTCLPAGKILPIVTLISLIFFAGSVNAQNYEVCKEKMQSIQDKCDKSFEECNNPCKSLTGTAWSSCYTACSRANYDCYQKSVSPYNECLEQEINCEEDGKITGSKDCENVQDRKDESSTKQSNQNNDKKELNDIFSFIPVFNLESIPQFVGITGFHTITAPEQIKETTSIDFQGLLNRKPTISATDENKAWTGEYKNPGQNDIVVIKGQGQLTSSKSSQSINVGGNNQFPFVAYVDSIFTGATSEMVTFRYAWDTKSGAVINVFPQAEVQFGKPVSGDAAKEAKRMIMLNKGEIEVKVKNTNPENRFGVQTEILDLIVIGTHFWVSHDPDKKQTVVAVYEGKVEAKTNDGKRTRISPEGGKPGIVVVAQKLSVIKLGIAGLILAAAIVGVIFFLKRRNSKAFIFKKKTAKR